MRIENVSRDKLITHGSLTMYKDTGYLEFTVSLFTRCNLRCSFCAQEHYTDLKPGEMNKIANTVYTQYIKEKVSRDEINTVKVRIWGGELFSDDIPDYYFYSYRKLRQAIEELFKDEPVQPTFCFTTNGVLTKHNRLLNFLEESDEIAVSYNVNLPAPQLNKIDNTIEALSKEHKVTVSFMLIFDAIKWYMGNWDKFKAIVNSDNVSDVVLNWYIPCKGWMKDYAPSWLVGQFLIKCLNENLTKIQLVRRLKDFQSDKKECECKFLPNIFDGKVTKDCVKCFSNLDRTCFYGENVDILIDESTTQKENISETKAFSGMVVAGCFECEHIEYCPGMCWASVLFMKNLEEWKCPLKYCYKHLLGTKL